MRKYDNRRLVREGCDRSIDRKLSFNPRRRVRIACIASLMLMVTASFAVFVGPASAASITITIDYNTTIGNNKLSMGSMIDWESKSFTGSSTMQQLYKSANFKLVRLFDVRIQPCTRWYESSKTGSFNWASVDALVRSIFNAGGQPLICFGHFAVSRGPPTVPSGMAINPYTKLPYPASYAAYCAQWVKHFKSVGLPVKYYEVMNEGYFYYGWDYYETKLIGNFVQLVNAVLRGMRSANIGLSIGYNAFLQKKFLDYFVKYGDNLDWIGITKYGLGEGGGTDAQAFTNAVTQKFTVSNSLWYTLDQARSIWASKRGKTLPVILCESNFSYAWKDGTDSRNCQMAGAVYIALVLRECVLRKIDYHCFYTYASSASAGHWFGMLNLDTKQPWYPYYVQKMLGTGIGVGDTIKKFTSSSSSVSGLAWIHNGKKYFLLIQKSTSANTVYLKGVTGSLSYSKISNAIYWKTPKVQTGTVSSGQALYLSGYTVALFQAQA